jgi:hypothetical protein
MRDRVDLSLSLDAVAKRITITKRLPIVDTTTAILGGTFNNAGIKDMPATFFGRQKS